MYRVCISGHTQAYAHVILLYVTMMSLLQVVLSKAPEDLMLVTLNHLDTMRDMVSSSDQLVAAINDIHRRLRGVRSYVPVLLAL